LKHTFLPCKCMKPWFGKNYDADINYPQMPLNFIEENKILCPRHSFLFPLLCFLLTSIKVQFPLMSAYLIFKFHSIKTANLYNICPQVESINPWYEFALWGTKK
jgi:hypothetical protein